MGILYCRFKEKQTQNHGSNNALVMDLSNPNRSLKIAERFNEIYDYQWNIAVDKLEGLGKEEEEGIKILLDIITVRNPRLNSFTKPLLYL